MVLRDIVGPFMTIRFNHAIGVVGREIVTFSVFRAVMSLAQFAIEAACMCVALRLCTRPVPYGLHNALRVMGEAFVSQS